MIAVWFRHDLRLLDNTAWRKAEALGPIAHAFYVDTPKQQQQHDLATIKQQFISDHVDSVAQSVQAQEITWHRWAVDDFAAVPQALLDFAQEHGITDIVANREYAVNEVARDKACAQLLRQHGITLRLPHDQAVIAPGKVLTQQQKPYTVYSPFYRNWAKQLQTYPSLPANFTPPENPDDSAWPVGEAAAWQALQQFCESKVHRYKKQRDLPAIKGTSRLSAYLACGVISPRVCVQTAIDSAGGLALDESVETWVKELAWRDFYIHILYHFPDVCRHKAFKPDTEQLQWRTDEQDFSAWCEGRTGIPIVDAAMRQLNQTGWMHNRLRMVTAMFLTKHLLIDWRKGEQYFMRHLIDGHLASNNGGWQWAASTGTDAAPYFRIFNPVRQSEKFDPDGEFIHRYVPELAKLSGKALHLPTDAQRKALAPDYPAPIVDLAEGRDRALAAFKAIAKS